MKTRIAAALAECPDINKTRRCQLLGVNRSTLYYKPVHLEEDDIFLMNLIRDIWLKRPFYGYRRITKELQVPEYRIKNSSLLKYINFFMIPVIPA